MIFDKSTSLSPMFADSKTSSSLSQREGTEGRECKYSRELTDSDGEAEAGIPF